MSRLRSEHVVFAAGLLIIAFAAYQTSRDRSAWLPWAAGITLVAVGLFMHQLRNQAEATTPTPTPTPTPAAAITAPTAQCGHTDAAGDKNEQQGDGQDPAGDKNDEQGDGTH